MTRLAATASQTLAMGQTSSQIHDTRAPQLSSEDQPNGNRKNPKSKKSKRKSADVVQSLDPESEGAKPLLQMRAVPLPYDPTAEYGNDLAASQQLIAETSPMRSPDSFNADETKAGSLEKRKKQRKRDVSEQQKRSSGVVFEDPNIEEGNEELGYLQFPSTPPRQDDPPATSPSRSKFPRGIDALDDVPTDDEAAVFDEAFRNETAAAPPDMPFDDIFSFSQQPPDASDHQDEMLPTYQLPTQVYTSPRAVKRPKKRKRDTAFVVDAVGEEQLPVATEAGQYMLDCDLGSFDSLFQVDLTLADPFHYHQGHDMHIDPKLHSMSALPASVDLSALENGDGNVSHPRNRRAKQSRSSHSNKRRRTDDFPSSQQEHRLNHTPEMLRGDQENTFDGVLPEFEDYVRKSSPELGTLDIARGSLNYLNNTPKPGKTLRQGQRSWQTKKKGTRKSTGSSTGMYETNENGYLSERSLKDISENGGPFTSAEVAKLDAFRDSYCDANNMNYYFFNSLIQASMRGNPQVTELFNEIHGVLPYRSRLSVQKAVRRRFHNYTARGTWTAEEDEMLRRAVVEKGKQWKDVGEMIDRMPDDCRDRYRNYLLNSEHRNREQWTEDEVKNLCTAILECMELLKDERRRVREEKYGPDSQELEEGSDQEVEDIKVINWQAVSDRMGKNGGGRSRLQCSGKWAQLKKKDQNELLNIVREARGLERKRSGPTKNPWRQKRAMRKVANMKTGDQYIFLQFILKCSAPTEGNIPWQSLGDKDFRATWTVADKKSAWLKMKESIAGSEGMDYREIINRLIARILTEGAGELDERWDPKVHGDVSQTKPRKSKKAKGKEREGASTEPETRRSESRADKRKQAKSSEFVEDVDDEDDDDGIDQPQDHNRYDALPMSAEATSYADTNDEAASNNAYGHERDKNANQVNGDRDSLFDGSDEDGENRPRDDREVTPQMASRIELLQFG